MIKRILVCFFVFVSLLISAYVLTHRKSVPIDMPLVQNDPFAYLAKGYMPIEQRNDQYSKWLSVGVKIVVSGASGSGTIIYYNEIDGYAYIQSCGHLWDGNMSAQDGKNRMITCKIITWYHNVKLDSPKTYSAEVLYYSNNKGRDCSLLRFKPDWTPEYFPIAPEDFEFLTNTRFHSVGCDAGSEVANYDVKYVGMRGDQWPDLVTTENSPRPGRSGGGLMSDHFYVAICWGTSAFDGGGNGFFTPLKTLREYNKINGYGWLNEVGYSLARQIPIIDRNNPQKQHPKDYIPLPDKN
jgi:hypothetical protein